MTNFVINLKLRIIIAVGASIPICSIIGLSYSRLFFCFLKKETITKGVQYILLTLFYLQIISLLPAIDYWGHLGGLISGLLIGLGFTKH